MRIKKGFVLHKFGDEYLAVAVGEEIEKFKGMVRVNEVGAYIWNLMKEETTKDEIVNSILRDFNGAEKTVVEADVDEFLQSIDVAVAYSENERN